MKKLFISLVVPLILLFILFYHITPYIYWGYSQKPATPLPIIKYLFLNNSEIKKVIYITTWENYQVYYAYTNSQLELMDKIKNSKDIIYLNSWHFWQRLLLFNQETNRVTVILIQFPISKNDIKTFLNNHSSQLKLDKTSCGYYIISKTHENSVIVECK